ASETFQALLAPAGTPKEIVDRLAKETTEILQRPDVREKLRSSGFNPVGSGPEALQARVAEEVAMWREVIARTGLKVEGWSSAASARRTCKSPPSGLAATTLAAAWISAPRGGWCTARLTPASR